MTGSSRSPSIFVGSVLVMLCWGCGQIQPATPTATVAPTATETPVPTPLPTDTPLPTVTPLPSVTPTATTAVPLITPLPVVAADKIAAGGYHTCVTTSAGNVRCWGLNGSGQLGDGTTVDRYLPVTVAGLPGAVTGIAAGAAHTCARMQSGGVVCWGANNHGQLGNGTFSTAVLSPGYVTGLASGVIAIAAGGDHTCALSDKGVVTCWGTSEFGQVGNGTKAADFSSPQKVKDLPANITAVAAGERHSCALTDKGVVYCWGAGGNGAVGDSSFNTRTTAVLVTDLAAGVKTLTAGGYHNCAIMTDKSLECWGNDGYGERGDGTYSKFGAPTAVVGDLPAALAVADGLLHTCAIVQGGAVYCWGDNRLGQLGVDPGVFFNRSVPLLASDMGSGAVAITAGWSHTCARMEDGGVRCWGGGGFGQLGNGATGNSYRPVIVLGFPGSPATPTAMGK